MSAVTIEHVIGPLRGEAQALLERAHYRLTSGNSGAMIAAIDRSGGPPRVVGACLVGGTASRNAQASLIAPPWPVRVIKRLYIEDGCPVVESQLQRWAMRWLANHLGRPYLMVAYAEPDARDERTGRPLLGWVYLATGMFYLGETGPREVFFDEMGRARSRRQGRRNLSRATLPADWVHRRPRPARIFGTVVVPRRIVAAGRGRRLGQRQRDALFVAGWRALNPARRVAAPRWIEAVRFDELAHAGVIERVAAFDRTDGQPLCDADGRLTVAGPRQVRGDRLWMPGRYPGALMGEPRAVAPVWVPYLDPEQLRLFEGDDSARERTGGRHLVPPAA